MLIKTYFCNTLNTDKKHIQHLAAICALKGLEYAVISPGSRCAPLIVAFNRQPGIKCISIIDERSAAFVALGIAQQSKKPVALICTSGSAILNYAPALAEAFYQKVPLIVLSADRPNEWIDQGENQSILQYEVYKNYIKKSFQLPLQVNTEKDLWYSDRLVSEAMNTCLYPDFGPVHINIPLREPLYNLVEDDLPQAKIVEFAQAQYGLNVADFELLAKEWMQFKKILIVVGSFKHQNELLSAELQQLSKRANIVVLKEAISNVYGEDFIDQIDANIEQILHQQLDEFSPDLVITLGGGVVSKKLKFWLREQKHLNHWHLTRSFEHWDNFQALSKVLQLDLQLFFNYLNQHTLVQESNYKMNWLQLNAKSRKHLNEFLAQESFVDFTLFSYLLKALPTGSYLQLGNSTPVRYANLVSIPEEKHFKINSNRGVSGIDGVLSTAAGASIYQENELCFCITGDVAALYDSNALLNKSLKANFKLIIINNDGGNIFRIIPGPDQLDELEQFFETRHDINFEYLAQTYHFKYFSASDMESVEKLLPNFIAESEQCAILEIKTDGKSSALSLRNYFKSLRV